MNSGIYQINNLETGAFYIGQSIELQTRPKKHVYQLNRGTHANKHLQRSWNKWGEDAFTFEILELCPEKDLDDREDYWIGDMWQDEYELCYNKIKGGNSRRPSKSTRAKQSEAHRGEKNYFFGKKLSEEHRRKISKANKIAAKCPETKRKRSEAQKIAANRPERTRKLRQARGKHFTCTWPDGRTKHYLSTAEAAPELGVGRTTILRYLEGTFTPGMSKRTAHLRECIFQYCVQ